MTPRTVRVRSSRALRAGRRGSVVSEGALEDALSDGTLMSRLNRQNHTITSEAMTCSVIDNQAFAGHGSVGRIDEPLKFNGAMPAMKFRHKRRHRTFNAAKSVVAPFRS